MHNAVRSCGYTFLFNLLRVLEHRYVTYVNYVVTNAKCLLVDYSVGVMPVAHVDK